MNLRTLTTFVTIISLISSQSYASLYMFRAEVLAGIERLKSPSIDEFEKSIDSMERAYQEAPTSQSRKAVRQALAQFNDGRKVGSLASTQAVSRTLLSLKEAFNVRTLIPTQSSYSETDFLENMIKRHLFPNAPEKVRINFEGVDRENGILAMATFIADPRTVIADNLISQLITKKDIYGEPANAKVVFSVETADIVVPSDFGSVIKFTNELKMGLDKSITEAIGDQNIVRGRVNVMDRTAYLYLEFQGYEYAAMINDYLLNVFSQLNGNRFIEAGANGAAKLSEFLQTAHAGGVATIKTVLNRAGKAVESVENAMRSKFLSKAWVEPTADTVRQKINAVTDMRVQDVKNELARRTNSINGAAIDETTRANMLKEAEVTAQQKISALQADRASKLSKIDDAIKNVTKRGALNGMSEVNKTRYLRGVAEKASGIRTFTFNRLLQRIAVITAAVVIYKGVSEVVRAETRDQMNSAINYYGSETVQILLMFLPVTREFTVAVWALTGAFNLTIGAATGIHLPNIADLVAKLGDFGSWLGYKWAGTTEFAVFNLDLRNKLNAHGPQYFPGIKAHMDVKGYALIRAIETCDLELDKTNCAIDVFVKRNDYQKYVSAQAQAELFYYYNLNTYTENQFNKEFANYIEERIQVYTGKAGYFTKMDATKTWIDAYVQPVVNDALNGNITLSDELKAKLDEAINSTSVDTAF